MTTKIPVPNSDVVDKGGRTSREWFAYFERLGAIVNLLDSLPQGKIWIGNSASVPIANAISGDITLSSAGVVTLVASANVVEIIQDNVGTILADSSTIDFTYSDATPSITASIVAGSVGPTELAATAVTPGAYTAADITVDADGRITAAANGAGVTSAAVRDAGYWSPLTNGDVANPEPIFALGDTIAIWATA